MDEQVVREIIKSIEDRFGKMVVTRGKYHNFVGMGITFKENGTLEVLMNEYITECFEAFGEPIDKSANTLAKHHLFETTVSAPLSEDKMEVFHHIVAKLLYAK